MFTKGREKNAGLLGILTLLVVLTAVSHTQANDKENSFRYFESSGHSLTYKDCVHIALKQSPFLTRSSIEIDIRRLAEKDAKWSYVPDLTFRSVYYLNYTDNNNSDDDRFTINFSSGNYNPLISYFSLKSSRLITQTATMAHLKVISGGLFEMAKMFVQLDSLDQQAVLQKQKVALTLELQEFSEKAFEMGRASALQVEMARQAVAMAEAEAEKLQVAQEMILEALGTFLDQTPMCMADLDLAASRAQLLAGFDPATHTLKKAENDSFDLKLQDFKEKLYEKRITLAKAQFMPNFSFGVRTPDPTSENTGNQDYYVSLNFNYLLWDGFQRNRDITRKRLEFKQTQAESFEKKVDFEKKWKQAELELKKAAAGIRLAHSAENMALLQARQKEIQYQSGSITFAELAEGRIDHLDAQIRTLGVVEDYDLAVLGIKDLTEDLFHAFVDVESGEE